MEGGGWGKGGGGGQKDYITSYSNRGVVWLIILVL